MLDLVTASRLEREILIVASDAQLRIAMEQALSSQGYRRLHALSVSEALTQDIEATRLLCVLCLDGSGCDMAMNLVRRFRQKSTEVNFIVVTELASQETDLMIPVQGDLQVLVRPFLMLEFIATVERAI